MGKKISLLILALTMLAATAMPAFAEYAYEPLTVSVPVKVENAVETSHVRMVTKQDSPAPAIEYVQPDSNGNATFSITYNEPGEYEYTITQEQTGEGIIADKTEFLVKIFVKDEAQQGNLSGQVLVYLNAKDEKPNEVVFKNEKEKDPSKEKKKTDDKTSTKTPESGTTIGRNGTNSTSGTTTNTGTSGSTANAKTGDNNPIYLWGSVCTLSLMIILGLSIRKKRK